VNEKNGKGINQKRKRTDHPNHSHEDYPTNKFTRKWMLEKVSNLIIQISKTWNGIFFVVVDFLFRSFNINANISLSTNTNIRISQSNNVFDFQSLLQQNMERNLSKSLKKLNKTKVNNLNESNNDNCNIGLVSDHSWIISLLSRCLDFGSDGLECRMSVLTGLYLDCINPILAPIPTVEQYQEILPKRTNFERDLYYQKIFSQSPILFAVLDLIAEVAVEFVRCLEVIRSLLANQIGAWNSLPLSQPSSLVPACHLVNLCRKAQWIPEPLCFCADIFPFISPSEITTLLMSFWNFLRDFPPHPSQYSYSNFMESEETNSTTTSLLRKGAWTRQFPPNLNVQPYLVDLKHILRNHITVLAPFYHQFYQ